MDYQWHLPSNLLIHCDGLKECPSVPRLLPHSPNKYSTMYQNDPIGQNSNLEYPIGQI
jgi:hypothetical protein